MFVGSLSLSVSPVYLSQLPLLLKEVEKFPQALGLQALDPFLSISKQGPCFRAIDEDRGDKRLAELELARKANGVTPLDSD